MLCLHQKNVNPVTTIKIITFKCIKSILSQHKHIGSVCLDRCVYKSSSRRHHLYPIDSLFILSYKHTSHGSQCLNSSTATWQRHPREHASAAHVCEGRKHVSLHGHRDTLPSNAALQAPLHRCNYTVIVFCLFLFNCAPCVHQ